MIGYAQYKLVENANDSLASWIIRASSNAHCWHIHLSSGAMRHAANNEKRSACGTCHGVVSIKFNFQFDSKVVDSSPARVLFPADLHFFAASQEAL